MTAYKLIAVGDAAPILGAVFDRSQTCRIEVREDKCFSDENQGNRVKKRVTLG
jgi:hypothetical protein